MAWGAAIGQLFYIGPGILIHIFHYYYSTWKRWKIVYKIRENLTSGPNFLTTGNFLSPVHNGCCRQGSASSCPQKGRRSWKKRRFWLLVWCEFQSTHKPSFFDTIKVPDLPAPHGSKLGVWRLPKQDMAPISDAERDRRVKVAARQLAMSSSDDEEDEGNNAAEEEVMAPWPEIQSPAEDGAMKSPSRPRRTGRKTIPDDQGSAADEPPQAASKRKKGKGPAKKPKKKKIKRGTQWYGGRYGGRNTNRWNSLSVFSSFSIFR